MPARTLSPFLATDRALLTSPPARPHPHHDPHHDPNEHRGTYVDLQRDFFAHHVLYDTRHAYNADFPHFGPPAQMPVQPASPFPPGWAPHPPPTSRLSPPPLLHKVWILDCKACGTFLTNRGMKAVLLLRPNVPLYSTDALPVNCSAHVNMLDESLVKREPPSPSLLPATANDDPARPPSSRTCECLTQTLYCHGCGKGVGYMIVIPCHRCTSSMTVSHRMTNGHRFVFYSFEIAPSERHYVPGEPGVMAHDVPPVPAPFPHSMGFAIPVLPTAYPPQHPTPPVAATPRRTTRSRRGAHTHTHARTPSSPRSRRSTLSSDPGSPPPLMPLTPPSLYAATNSGGVEPAGPHAQVGPHYARIGAGDVLFWHNLVRCGEIPAVREDARARSGHTKEDECGAADLGREAGRDAAPATTKPRHKIVAGR